MKSCIPVIIILLFTCSSCQEHLEPIFGHQEFVVSHELDSGSADLMDFDIESDGTKIQEVVSSYSVDSSYQTVYIHYNDQSVQIGKDSKSKCIITTEGAHVVATCRQKTHFILSGASTNACFKLYGEYKTCITADNLHLTNPEGAAINIQSKKAMQFIVPVHSETTQIDGNEYKTAKGEDEKSCLFSEGNINLCGEGTLNVYGNGQDGIHSDGSITLSPGLLLNIHANKSDAIQAKKNIQIDGGVLNVLCRTSIGRGLVGKKLVNINGGKIIIICKPDIIDNSEDKHACCIKSDSLVCMTSGLLRMKNTCSAGRCINCDQEIKICGGQIDAIASGIPKGKSNSKGIRSEKSLMISDGTIRVRALQKGCEALEGKELIKIDGGTIEAVAYDDALSVGSLNGHIQIDGGNMYAKSINGDGIDSNGTISISGGTIFSYSTQGVGRGIDCDENYFSVTGGTFLGLGAMLSVPTTEACTQAFVSYTTAVQPGSMFAIVDAESSNILAGLIMPDFSNPVCMLFTSPSLREGTSYHLVSGGEISSTTRFQEFFHGGTISNRHICRINDIHGINNQWYFY